MLNQQHIQTLNTFIFNKTFTEKYDQDRSLRGYLNIFYLMLEKLRSKSTDYNMNIECETM